MCRSLEDVVKDCYAGLVSVDGNIGRVLECLERSIQLDKTAILHSSDRGYFLGDRRFFDSHPDDASLHVLCCGWTSGGDGLNLDLAPTLLEMQA
jgi:arylsulfatase A-like enzyme